MVDIDDIIVNSNLFFNRHRAIISTGAGHAPSRPDASTEITRAKRLMATTELVWYCIGSAGSASVENAIEQERARNDETLAFRSVRSSPETGQ